MKNSGIYQIKNTVTDKIYIGSTLNFIKRWNIHKRQLNKNIHHSIHLQRAWNKYGAEAFEFCVIEFVNDKTKLIEREQLWMNGTGCYYRNTGYNSNPTAGNLLGFKHSAESKLKMSKSQTGKKLSPEAILKLSIRNKTCGIRPPSNKGKHHSEETKIKIALAQKGKIISEESKRKMSLSATGKIISEAARRNMSLGQTGRKHAKDEVLKRRNFNKWPCELGSDCKCITCKERRTVFQREYRKSLKQNAVRLS